MRDGAGFFNLKSVTFVKKVLKTGQICHIMQHGYLDRFGNIGLAEEMR